MPHMELTKPLYQTYQDNDLVVAIIENDHARVLAVLGAGQDAINLVDISDLWVNADVTCERCNAGLGEYENYATPLQLATYFSSYEIFRLVLESVPIENINSRGLSVYEHFHHGDDVENDGRSALDIAAMHGLYKKVQLLN